MLAGRVGDFVDQVPAKCHDPFRQTFEIPWEFVFAQTVPYWAIIYDKRILMHHCIEYVNRVYRLNMAQVNTKFWSKFMMARIFGDLSGGGMAAPCAGLIYIPIDKELFFIFAILRKNNGIRLRRKLIKRVSTWSFSVDSHLSFYNGGNEWYTRVYKAPCCGGAWSRLGTSEFVR